MAGHNGTLQRWLVASKIADFIYFTGGFKIFCVLEYRVIRGIGEDNCPDSSTFDAVNTSSALYCFEDHGPRGCHKKHA